MADNNKRIKKISIENTSYDLFDDSAFHPEEDDKLIVGESEAIGANSLAQGESRTKSGGDDNNQEDKRINAAVGEASSAMGMGAVAFSRASKSLGYRTQTGYPKEEHEDDYSTNNGYLHAPENMSDSDKKLIEDGNYGQAAVAIGSDTAALANNSFAGGHKSKALGTNSFAFGANCTAGADRAIVIGLENSNSSTNAIGAVVIGSYNKDINNPGVVVLGNHLKTSKQDQIALGTYNDASNSDSIFMVGNGTSTARHNAINVSTTNIELDSPTIRLDATSTPTNEYDANYINQGVVVVAKNGVNLTTGGTPNSIYPGCFAMGNAAKAGAPTSNNNNKITKNLYATALGSCVEASGHCSFACGEGESATKPLQASGMQSFACNRRTKATGQASFACGSETQATGIGSFACGSKTQAQGSYSFAAGEYSIAEKSYSSAFGYKTQTTRQSQTVVGRRNNLEEDTNAIFIVGNGTDDNKRINAFVIDEDSNAKIKGNLNINGQIISEGIIHMRGEVKNWDTVGEDIVINKKILNEVLSNYNFPALEEIKFDELKTLQDAIEYTKSSETTEYSLAIGERAKAEGSRSIAIGDKIDELTGEHEAFEHIAEGEGSIIIGLGNNASGNYSFAAGTRSNAESKFGIALGFACTAGSFLDDPNQPRIDGEGTIAIGTQSTANGYGSIAIGHKNVVDLTDTNTHNHGVAIGAYNNVDRDKSIVLGYGGQTRDTGNGHYTSFAVGYGAYNNEIAEVNKNNIFEVDTAGMVYANGASINGGDYAEYFEWEDKNLSEEDRIGLVVTLDNGKIRPAQENETILGIISGTASVIGDAAEQHWQGKYLTDEFGRIQYEMIEENGAFVKQPKINPEYDPTQIYVPRSQRPEWAVVGLLGKIYTRDDGTCVSGCYAKVSENGILTYSIEPTNIQVLKRTNNNIVKVLLK